MDVNFAIDSRVVQVRVWGVAGFRFRGQLQVSGV